MAKAITYILLLAFMTVTAASFYNASANRQLEQMKKLVDILHEKLIREECPDPEQQRYKRSELNTPSDGIQLEAYKELYTHLVDLLIICRKAKQEKMSSTTKTTVPTTTSKKMTTTRTTTTTKPTVTKTTTATTTIPTTPMPVECVNAINLTESWRKDHSGSDIKPINGGYNCDTRDMINSGRPWFRFSGSAGTKLLNKCPPIRSCGTVASLWSNSTMSSTIGVETSFTAQGSYNNCNEYELQASVMRCSSAPSDFVYRYEDSDTTSNIGFCGMV